MLYREVEMLYFFYGLASVVVLYVLTATVFLLVAKIRKDEKGNLVLDPNSWHFKISYPFIKFSKYQILFLSEKVGLCGYFAKFFFMLYLGWPMLMVWACLKTIVYSPFMLLFGSYPIANNRSMDEAFEGPLAVEVGEIKMLKPNVLGLTIFPFYIIALLAYVFSWIYYPDTTWTVTFWCLVTIAVVVVAVAIIVGIYRFMKTDQETVYLIKEWANSKKKKLCPKMKIKFDT